MATKTYADLTVQSTVVDTDLLASWRSGGPLKSIKAGIVLPIVFAEHYGALGDGTTDDTTAIANAITALAALGGGTLYFGAKTYIISQIELQNNIALCGAGYATVLKGKASTSSILVYATGKNNVGVRNLKVDGNKTNRTGSNDNIQFTGCYAVTVDDIISVDSRNSCLAIKNGTDKTNDTYSYIDNVTAKGGTLYGVEIHDSNNVQVYDVRALNNTNAGVSVFGTTVGLIQSITLDNIVARENGASGIAIPFITGGTSADYGVKDVTITNCQAVSNGENGFLIQARVTAMAGCVATLNGTTSSHQGVLVNTLSVSMAGVQAFKNRGVGIDFGDCKRVVATGCYAEENGIIGIEVNSCEDISLTGCGAVNNCTTSGAGALSAGILIHKGTGSYVFPGNSKNVRISGCFVRPGTNQLYGIYVSADTENVIIDDACDFASSGTTRDIHILTPTANGFRVGRCGVAAPTKASATSITITQNENYFYVSGTTTIDNIVTDTAVYELGRIIVIYFTGVCTVRHNGGGTGNIYLTGSTNLTTTNGLTLTLIRADATGWRELARSTT